MTSEQMQDLTQHACTGPRQLEMSTEVPLHTFTFSKEGIEAVSNRTARNIHVTIGIQHLTFTGILLGIKTSGVIAC
jgi:hypothetical protein